MTKGVTSLPSFAQAAARPAAGGTPAGSSARQTGSFENHLASVQAAGAGSQSAARVATGTAPGPAVTTQSVAAPASDAVPTFLLTAGMGKGWSRKTGAPDAEGGTPAGPATGNADIVAMAQAVLLASGQLPTPIAATVATGIPGQEQAAAPAGAMPPANWAVPPAAVSAATVPTEVEAVPPAAVSAATAPTAVSVLASPTAAASTSPAATPAIPPASTADPVPTGNVPANPLPPAAPAQGPASSAPLTAVAPTPSGGSPILSAIAPGAGASNLGEGAATTGPQFVPSSDAAPTSTAAFSGPPSTPASGGTAEAATPATSAQAEAPRSGAATSTTPAATVTSSEAAQPSIMAATGTGTARAAATGASDGAYPAAPAIAGADAADAPVPATPVSPATTPVQADPVQASSLSASGPRTGPLPVTAAPPSIKPATARSPVAAASGPPGAAPGASAPSSQRSVTAAAGSDENGSGAEAPFSRARHPDQLSDPPPGTLDPAAQVAGPVPQQEAVLAGSAGQQVLAALSGLTGNTGAPDRATITDDGSIGSSATPGAAPTGKVVATADGGREIVVKLDPEHLGSVQIRLKMNGEKVDVSITVDNPSTLDLLNQDRHLLTSAVSSMGLGSGPLLLSHGGLDAASQPASPARGGSDMNGPSSQGGEAFASGDPTGAGQNRRGNGRAAPGNTVDMPEGDNPAPIPQARTEGLYV